MSQQPIDITAQGLVHTSATAEIAPETDHRYPTPGGPLAFDLYRPRDTAGPSGAVVFVTGFPDPGAAAFFGKPLKDWASYRDWARLVASAGLVAITYLNREPGDVGALFAHLRANAAALGIDPQRIGVWSCSGNAPQALALVARERPACAALLYPYTLDLPGAHHVREALARFQVVAPVVALAELPTDRPLLVVRAGRDQSPGLEDSLQAFLAAADQAHLPVTLVDHPEAPHAFDLVADSPRTRAVIDEVVAFLRATLRQTS